MCTKPPLSSVHIHMAHGITDLHMASHTCTWHTHMDMAHTGSYSVGMFFAGHLGDRLDLRLFLTVGMLGSALFVSLFGMAFFWNIHNIFYFVFVSVIAGTSWMCAPTLYVCMCKSFVQGIYVVFVHIENPHANLLHHPLTTTKNRSVSSHWVAQCRLCCGQLVWQGQAWPHHGHMERPHQRGQHSRHPPRSRSPPLRLGLVLYPARCTDWCAWHRHLFVFNCRARRYWVQGGNECGKGGR